MESNIKCSAEDSVQQNGITNSEEYSSNGLCADSLASSDMYSTERYAEYIGSFPVTGFISRQTQTDFIRHRLTEMKMTERCVPVVIMVTLTGIKVYTQQSPGSTQWNLTMSHALKRISYATCYPNQSQFSFLAREPKAPPTVQYCHAFHMKTPQEAEELNEFVGDVFKAAYTIVQHNHSPEKCKIISEPLNEVNKRPSDFAQLTECSLIYEKTCSGQVIDVTSNPSRDVTSNVSRDVTSNVSPDVTSVVCSSNVISCDNNVSSSCRVRRVRESYHTDDDDDDDNDDDDDVDSKDDVEISTLSSTTSSNEIRETFDHLISQEHDKDKLYKSKPRRAGDSCLSLKHPAESRATLTCNQLNTRSRTEGNDLHTAGLRSRDYSSGTLTAARGPSKTSASPSVSHDDVETIWYQPHASRCDVLERLCHEEIGSFIVRDSGTHSGCFALSVRVPKYENPAGVSHYLVSKTSKSTFKIKGVNKEWPSLKSLVTHHSVMREQLPCLLKLPNSRVASSAECDLDDFNSDDIDDF